MVNGQCLTTVLATSRQSSGQDMGFGCLRRTAWVRDAKLLAWHIEALEAKSGKIISKMVKFIDNFHH